MVCDIISFFRRESVYMQADAPKVFLTVGTVKHSLSTCTTVINFYFGERVTLQLNLFLVFHASRDNIGNIINLIF